MVAAHTPSMFVLIARQPILTRDERLYAYELLTRGSEGRALSASDGSVSTGSVLIGAVAEFGLEQLVGDVPAFVNVTAPFLTGELPLPVSPTQVVIEVLESVEPDPDTIAGLQRMKQLGYRIALDDYTGSRPGYEPFLQLADIVKVDCLAVAPEALSGIVDSLRPYGVTLLAEKVETRELHQRCLALGFELFQGYYFARPDVARAHAPGVDQTNLLNLLAELNQPNVEIEELDAIISRDAALSFKLLRVLNSANFGMARRIGTVGEMLIYLGPPKVREIANLLLLVRCDGKPLPLLMLAMQRASACQRLAGQALEGGGQRAFLVGLFSALDAILDMPLETALAALPLSEDVREAILYRRGELGAILDLALALERGDWNALDKAPIEGIDCERASLESITFTAQIERQIARV
jgi:c-di-GMP phosphodiesterase